MRAGYRRVLRRFFGVGMAVSAIFVVPILLMALGGCRPGPAPKATATTTTAIASTASFVEEGEAAKEAIRRGDFPTIHAISPQERSEYLGSQRCVQCHQKQAVQLKSRHARSLARVNHQELASLFEEEVELFDSALGVAYSTQVKNGRCLITARSQTKEAEAEPEWAFGSGDVGMTFVGKTAAGPTELRLTHYGRSYKWDFTPAQVAGGSAQSMLGHPLSKSEQVECFRCHSTALVKENDQLAPQKSLLGVGCEACHGPGRAHVQAVQQRSKDLKMRRLGEVRENVSLGLCGQCHRSPANLRLDQPGMMAQLPRLHGVALSLSGCFQKGKATCVSCHDVHQNADDTSRAVYNQRCLSCHTPGRKDQKACPPRPTGECVSCHMPSQEVTMPTRPKFRTHWIKVWPNMVEGQN